MKLISYILSIIVTICLFYCSGFCFFYGMAMEDALILIMSVLFMGMMYYFAKWTQIKDNEYTHKIIDILRKLCEEQ